MQTGDLLTWLLDGKLPHIGVVVSAGPARADVVHNIGAGVQQSELAQFSVHVAKGHYRWPVG